jgi:hypothetical protein
MGLQKETHGTSDGGMGWFLPIMRILDERIRIFFHPGSRVKKIPDPGSGSASKNLSILNQKIIYKLSEISRLFIPDPDPHHWFLPRTSVRLPAYFYCT